MISIPFIILWKADWSITKEITSLQTPCTLLQTQNSQTVLFETEHFSACFRQYCWNRKRTQHWKKIKHGEIKVGSCAVPEPTSWRSGPGWQKKKKKSGGRNKPFEFAEGSLPSSGHLCWRSVLLLWRNRCSKAHPDVHEYSWCVSHSPQNMLLVYSWLRPACFPWQPARLFHFLQVHFFLDTSLTSRLLSWAIIPVIPWGPVTVFLYLKTQEKWKLVQQYFDSWSCCQPSSAHIAELFGGWKERNRELPGKSELIYTRTTKSPGQPDLAGGHCTV